MSRTALAYRSTSTAPSFRPELVVETIKERRTRLSKLDDVVVVTAHLAGSPFAFTELYERYSARITSFVYRLIGDRERAEEITQETFLRVHRHIARFDRSKKFMTWIYTIAKNLAKNEIRNRTRHTVIPMSQLTDSHGHTVEFVDGEKGPDALYEESHVKRLVEEAALRLPPHFRQVFILREMEGKTYEEMAEICECNVGTIKSRLNRARTAFAAIITPYLG